MKIFEDRLPNLKKQSFDQKKKPTPAFLSTVRRTLHFDSNNTTLQNFPGPGNYEISKPIVKPLIQTLAKGQNAYIVKLNQIGSSSFKSQQRRFKYVFGRDYEIDEGLQFSNRDKIIQQSKGEELHRNPSIHQSIHVYKQKFKDIFSPPKIDRSSDLKLGFISQQDKNKQIKERNQEKLVIKRKKAKTKKIDELEYSRSLIKKRKDRYSHGLEFYNQMPHHKQANPSSFFASESSRQLFQTFTTKKIKNKDLKNKNSISNNTKFSELLVDCSITAKGKGNNINDQSLYNEPIQFKKKGKYTLAHQFEEGYKPSPIETEHFTSKLIDSDLQFRNPLTFHRKYDNHQQMKKLVKVLRSIKDAQREHQSQIDQKYNHLKYLGNKKLDIDQIDLKKQRKTLKIFDSKKLI